MHSNSDYLILVDFMLDYVDLANRGLPNRRRKPKIQQEKKKKKIESLNQQNEM